MNHANVEVSRELVDWTTKEVPATMDAGGADSEPTLVSDPVRSVRKIRLLAVTAVVETVTVPPTSVAVPAMAAAPPVGIPTEPGSQNCVLAVPMTARSAVVVEAAV